jgi:hypothetical protein
VRRSDVHPQIAEKHCQSGYHVALRLSIPLARHRRLAKRRPRWRHTTRVSAITTLREPRGGRCQCAAPSPAGLASGASTSSASSTT